MNEPDLRRFAPATMRNRDVILDVFKTKLHTTNKVIEIASGSGEHAVFFKSQLPHLVWQPSDVDADSRASIQAWADYQNVDLPTPLNVNVMRADWAAGLTADALVCINMIHIAPWAATIGLMHGAGQILSTGGLLVLYGPFKVDGQHTSESNHRFEVEFLKANNPEWGVRDLDDVRTEAAQRSMTLVDTVDMPANNKIVVFQKNN